MRFISAHHVKHAVKTVCLHRLQLKLKHAIQIYSVWIIKLIVIIKAWAEVQLLLIGRGRDHVTLTCSCGPRRGGRRSGGCSWGWPPVSVLMEQMCSGNPPSWLWDRLRLRRRENLPRDDITHLVTFHFSVVLVSSHFNNQNLITLQIWTMICIFLVLPND